MTNLTEQWKKGELEAGIYYIKTKDGIENDGFDGKEFGFFSDMEIDQILGKVPSYEQWQQMKAFCEGFNALNVAEENKSLKEKLEPFTDPYFRGLTTKDIAELAKKSIRLTTQHCDDNEKIEKLRVALLDCKEFLGRSIPPKTLKSIIEDIEEALNG